MCARKVGSFVAHMALLVSFVVKTCHLTYFDIEIDKVNGALLGNSIV